MKTLTGPGLFLAQFAQDTPPHNSLESIARWAKNYGYKGIQIPSWDRRFFDLDKAADSNAYCDEIKGKLSDIGIRITELSTHFQGQMVSVHPAYDAMFDGQVAPEYRGNPEKRRHWAAAQVKKAAKVSRQLGLDTHVTFPGSLAWPYFYPYPQRPDGLIEACFEEQARRWKPILDEFDQHGVDVCFEIHPSEDMFDGDTFELFLDKVGGHKRCNINYDASHFIKQGLDYLGLHRCLSRAHQGVPCEGRRIQPDRQARLSRRLQGLAGARGPRPLARRRAGELQGNLLAVRGL